MDPIAAALTAVLEGWGRMLLGPLADRTVFGAVSGADAVAVAVAVAMMLAMTALLHLAVTLIFRYVQRRRPQPLRPAATPAPVSTAAPVSTPAPAPAVAAPAESQHLAFLHLLQALRKPAYGLVWAVGLYFSVTPLILAEDPAHGLATLHSIGGAVFDLAVFGLLLWLVMRCTGVLEMHLTRWAARTSNRLDELLVPLIGRSLRILLPILGVIFALPLLHIPAAYQDIISRATSILLIIAVAAVLLQGVRAGELVLLARFDVKAANNLRARQVYTQVHVIGRVIDVAVGLLTLAFILMLFPQVRHVGASMLASAGIIGVIAGIAAQKTLANLLAGFQIALAQPMREDDVVIVEGEWGRIEVITLTYVVVHIWDDRRMVLPLSYFIEKPFQNWTRTSSGLLGSVFVWVDYTFPVEEARQALKQIIEASPRWDRRFWNLQVSDATEKTMQLRVLATSADSSLSWDLRCEIREKFIAYIQAHHPQSLPRLRGQLQERAPEAGASLPPGAPPPPGASTQRPSTQSA